MTGDSGKGMPTDPLTPSRLSFRGENDIVAVDGRAGSRRVKGLTIGTPSSLSASGGGAGSAFEKRERFDLGVDSAGVAILPGNGLSPEYRGVRSKSHRINV
jgi:hypothetical protein